MTKKEMIDAIIHTAAKNGDGREGSESMRRTRLQTEATLEAFAEVATKELASGGEIAIPGVGKLKAKNFSERNVRNPRTGETMTVPANRRAVFLASKKLKEALNK